MARKSLIVRHAKMMKEKFEWKKPTRTINQSTKYYNRCLVCGRVKWFVREFGMCRICVRKYARKWELMWVRKSSW